jgi:hypothetical protein
MVHGASIDLFWLFCQKKVSIVLVGWGCRMKLRSRKTHVGLGCDFPWFAACRDREGEKTVASPFLSLSGNWSPLMTGTMFSRRRKPRLPPVEDILDEAGKLLHFKSTPVIQDDVS